MFALQIFDRVLVTKTQDYLEWIKICPFSSFSETGFSPNVTSALIVAGKFITVINEVVMNVSVIQNVRHILYYLFVPV